MGALGPPKIFQGEPLLALESTNFQKTSPAAGHFYLTLIVNFQTNEAVLDFQEGGFYKVEGTNSEGLEIPVGAMLWDI